MLVGTGVIHCQRALLRVMNGEVSLRCLEDWMEKQNIECGKQATRTRQTLHVPGVFDSQEND
jgi:hypothetical protein